MYQLRQKGLGTPVIIAAVLVVVAVALIGWKYYQPQGAQVKPPSATASPQAAVSKSNKVKIFLVALEDNGKQGKKIGCDDSLISQEKEITAGVKVEDQIKAALETLFSFKNSKYSAGSTYSGLANAQVKVDDVSISDGKAKVRLSGSLNLGGDCDNPRVEEQIKATVLQFSEVKEAEILLNGKPLHDVLSGKGGE